jgi:hypothetical protein
LRREWRRLCHVPLGGSQLASLRSLPQSKYELGLARRVGAIASHTEKLAEWPLNETPRRQPLPHARFDVPGVSCLLGTGYLDSVVTEISVHTRDVGPYAVMAASGNGREEVPQGDRRCRRGRHSLYAYLGEIQ